jgi:hypothetical protein
LREREVKRKSGRERETKREGDEEKEEEKEVEKESERVKEDFVPHKHFVDIFSVSVEAHFESRCGAHSSRNSETQKLNAKW